MKDLNMFDPGRCENEAQESILHNRTIKSDCFFQVIKEKYIKKVFKSRFKADI